MASDTIAAVATPTGVGGLGIVRVSGPEAFPIAVRLFRGPHFDSHRMAHGRIVDENGETVDDVVLLPFRGPQSYTGEDVAEFCCHGGPAVLAAVLRLCYAAGARSAEPGEFTKRAFLNGKLDLAQAEAVADLIHAGAESQRRLAIRQIEGKLSGAIARLRDSLMAVLASAEATVDFSEEVGELDTGLARSRLTDALAQVAEMEQGFAHGRMVREGAVVAIAGLPNAGKSSLLNALLGMERAIVTDIPGTTRDTIEDRILIDDVPVTLLDTAGVRESQDPVERLGVRRTEEALDAADLVLLTLAPESCSEPGSAALADKHRSRLISVRNKSDLAWPPGHEGLPVSAKTGEGLEALRVEIRKRLIGRAPAEAALVSRERHRAALQEAATAIHHGLVTLDSDVPTDFLCIDLRGALDALGLITGETVTADIVERIFSDFCIGK